MCPGIAGSLLLSKVSAEAVAQRQGFAVCVAGAVAAACSGFGTVVQTNFIPCKSIVHQDPDRQPPVFVATMTKVCFGSELMPD